MDTIYINGAIETMRPGRVSALAVKNGRIAYAGSDEDTLRFKSGTTEVVDLNGAFVLPGFNDTHIHTLNTGQAFSWLDLRGTKSVEEIIEMGKAYLEGSNPKEGDWIRGFGFNHNTFDEVRLPTRHDLDQISTSYPIVVSRICGHIASANTVALNAAGVTGKTLVAGGEIGLDEDGEPNGILSENALDLVYSKMPPMDKERAYRNLALAVDRFAQAGLTAVHSDDLSSLCWEDFREIVRKLKKEDRLSVRIYEECQGPTPTAVRRLASLGLYSGCGDDDLKVECVKILADGSLGAATAYMSSEYVGSDSKGVPIYTQDQIDEIVAVCQELDFAVACHCIGDGALEMFLNAVEKAVTANPKPLRHRVVHCQIGREDLYQKMLDLNVGADIQPPFTATDAPIVAARVGEDLEALSYNWKRLLDMGIPLEGGSDSPVESFDPLWGIYCAVTRKDANGEGPWLPDQRLSVLEAVKLYTTSPTEFQGNAGESGTLAAGHFADFVVLDADLFAIDPEAIKDVKVLKTVKGGKVTYEKSQA